MMDVKEIVKEYLKDHGYDGLYHDSDCGCTFGDLMCCEASYDDCRPGVFYPEKGEGWIGPRVDKTPAEICAELECNGINDKCPGNPMCPLIIYYKEDVVECKFAAEYMKKQIDLTKKSLEKK